MAGMLRRGTCVVLAAGVMLLGARPALAQQPKIAFSDEAVEKAIEKAKKHLWSMYNDRDGRWPDFPPDEKTGKPHQYLGGYNCLAIYALLAAGENVRDPKIKKALRWLASTESSATYVLGLRCQVWSFIPVREKEVEDEADKDLPNGRALLAKDSDRLIKSICRTDKPVTGARNPAWGGYGYTSDGKIGQSPDHSNTQYGILGVWAAALANMEVSKEYWELVYAHWMITQCADGGWSYAPSAGPTGIHTMTAAGLASMFVAYDYLFANDFVQTGKDSTVPTIKRGLEWFEKRFGTGEGLGGYYLYGIERVGLASGYKYFGAKDWYKIGATGLINAQAANGSWGAEGMEGGEIGATAFRLLFLVRGRNPVLFNRLEYKGDWNNRPRALANLTRWMTRGPLDNKEVSWQIINFTAPVEDWHDAPILMITGATKPAFAPAELEKLRTFVLQGGMIFSIAEGKTGTVFDAAMRGKGGFYEQLFPNYELRQIEADHALFKSSGEGGAYFKLKKGLKMWGLSNGVRLLAVHCADDLPVCWQTNASSTATDEFYIAINLARYASDLGAFRHRGVSVWPGAKDFTPARSVKLARVKFTGLWDPEPLAWERLKLLAGVEDQIKITTEVKTPSELRADQFRVAALTGVGGLNLSPEELEALRAYVTAGGTLIIDAAGGSEKFAESANEMLGRMFGAEALRPLPSMHPLYRQAGLEVDSVKYRRSARAKVGNLKMPKLLTIMVDDRPAVFFSKEDLTAGLLGCPIFGCIGYDPASAVDIMRNLVVYGNRLDKKAIPTTASAPAAK